MTKETKEFLENQNKIISRIEMLLDELLTTTEEDHKHGRGFGSFYPEKCMKLMMTMKYAIRLELEDILKNDKSLEHHKQHCEGTENLKKDKTTPQ